jgi:hypothetical protein
VREEGEEVKEDDINAFPVPETEWHHRDDGMSLRDYFAATLNLGEVRYSSGVGGGDSVETWALRHAKWRYMIADAMLKARKE